MNQYLKIPLLIILANTYVFSQESEGGANLDQEAQVRISKVTFSNGTQVLNDDATAMLLPGSPHMIDEINNEKPSDDFPDGFPDKIDQPKPNQVKSYAYSYISTAKPTIEGIFKWRGTPVGGPFTATAKVIDTDNCLFTLPEKLLIDDVRYPATTTAENIVIQRKIQAYVTSNRKVERKNKAGDDMAAKLKPIKICWTVKNAANKVVGWSDSLHTIYVTWDTAATALRQESIFNLSTVTCNGKTASNDVEKGICMDRVFSEFEDVNVLNMYSKVLFYYDPTLPLASDTSDLLKSENGDCEAWANFYSDCVKAIPVAAEAVKINPNRKDTFLLIPRTYQLFDLNPAFKAQGGLARPLTFNFHQGVTFGTRVTQTPALMKIYDPSYGLIQTGNLLWESNTVNLYRMLTNRSTTAADQPAIIDCLYTY